MVRKNETDYIRGSTSISKYVIFSMHDTIEKIDAYLNSKHTSGEQDEQGRDKPFFNIGTSAANIWFRMTDIDRKDIRIIATKASDYIDAFLGTILLRNWMRHERFGMFLNEWGRVLSRYGSAVIKFVENDTGLHIQVLPWNELIVDSVDIEQNPIIEVLWLTPAQLQGRVKTHGYDQQNVEALLDAVSSREIIDRRRKDSKNNYIKIYELHGNLPLAKLTGKDTDAHIYVQQMHVISFVKAKGSGRRDEYEDFTLYAGKEDQTPYMVTHLIKEEGRSLAIGAVEFMFEAQWMENHAQYSIKNTLDIASKLIFQTADANFVGNNVLSDMEDGMILVHGMNTPLTMIPTAKPDVQLWANFAANWLENGKELTGTPDSLRGVSGGGGVSAFRAQAFQAQQAAGLYDLMTENKGLYIEEMIRTRILAYLKKKYLNNAKEISDILSDAEVKMIDGIYIKNQAIRNYNKRTVDTIIGNIQKKNFAPIPQFDEQGEQQKIKDQLAPLGNRRFFKPDDLDDATWAAQLKDLEWEVEVDVTGEAIDVKENLAVLVQLLGIMAQPGFNANPQSQAIVSRFLELSGAMSPVEFSALQPPPPPAPPTPPAPIPSPMNNLPPVNNASAAAPPAPVAAGA